MKKLSLLVIAIILVLGMTFGLSACNNATTEGQLENIFFDYQGTGSEIYTYDVVNSENSATGTYKITIKTYPKNESVTVGDFTLTEHGAGYLVTDDNENVIAITKECRCNINDKNKRYRVRSISKSGSIGK